MKKDISLKEIVESFFNSHEAVTKVCDIKSGKSYNNRKIESYNSKTGNFMISGCKIRFNLNEQRSVMITIDAYSSGWCEFICKKYFHKSFRDTRERLEYMVSYGKASSQRFGGSWLKRTSDPRTFTAYINETKIEGVMTYGTATDFDIDGWRVGAHWSNTSSKHARAAGYGRLEYNFYPESND